MLHTPFHDLPHWSLVFRGACSLHLNSMMVKMNVHSDHILTHFLCWFSGNFSEHVVDRSNCLLPYFYSHCSIKLKTDYSASCDTIATVFNYWLLFTGNSEIDVNRDWTHSQQSLLPVMNIKYTPPVGQWWLVNCSQIHKGFICLIIQLAELGEVLYVSSVLSESPVSKGTACCFLCITAWIVRRISIHRQREAFLRCIELLWSHHFDQSVLLEIVWFDYLTKF